MIPPERKVLFVCFGNLCRSPMAEGFFNASKKEASLRAESAGVGAVRGAPPSRPAVWEMKRRGIDISTHRAQSIRAVNLTEYNVVVAMDREVAEMITMASPNIPDLRVWEIRDPIGGSAGDYREAADRILSRVKQLLGENLKQKN
jgi:protein-tyrosine-phosphatase